MSTQEKIEKVGREIRIVKGEKEYILFVDGMIVVTRDIESLLRNVCVALEGAVIEKLVLNIGGFPR